MKPLLCFDVGGTEIKVGLFDSYGKLLVPIQAFPSKATESCKEILMNFTNIYHTMQLTLPIGTNIEKVAFAFPGPFDYTNGISYIKGIGKYDALYEKSFGTLFRNMIGKPKLELFFCNDVSAFAYGHLSTNANLADQKNLFICIGTGCGSAFSYGTTLLDEHTEHVPVDGYLYNTPFQEGIIDDYLSKRGLKALTRQIFGYEMEGFELSLHADRQDERAISSFHEFGQTIFNALSPYLLSFQPKALILGGQIIKSGHYFLTPLKNYCTVHNIQVITDKDNSYRCMLGLFYISNQFLSYTNPKERTERTKIYVKEN